MQRILFHKIHDIKNKLLIIIHADKNECSKRDKFFSYKTSSFFSSLSLWNKRSSHDVFSLKTSLPNTRANNLFSKKANNQGVARFQKQIILDSHQKQFLFSKCKIKILRFILNPYSTKLKRREMGEWPLKTIICLSRWQSTLRGNDQYKGATLCLEEKNSRKKDGNFLQPDKGASWFTKDSLILSASDIECFQQWNEE